MTATRLAPQASRGPQVHADPWPEEHPSAAALRALPHAAPVAFWVDHLPPRDSEPPLSGLVEADLCVVRDGFTGFWAALAAKKDDPQQEVVLLEAGRDSVATRTRFVNTRPTPFPPEPLQTAVIQYTRNRLAAAGRNGSRRGPGCDCSIVWNWGSMVDGRCRHDLHMSARRSPRRAHPPRSCDDYGRT